MRRCIFLALVAVLLSAPALAEAGRKVPNFRLLDTRGFSHELDRYHDAAALVLVTWDAKSPDAAAASGQLAALAQEFQSKGVQFFAIDPAPRGDATADAARIEVAPAGNAALLKGASALLGSLGVPTKAASGADAVPVLRDAAQVVTPALGVSNAFEVLVLAPKDRAVLFQGGLPAAGDALRQVLAGQPVAAAATPSSVPLALAALPAAPAYVKEVAPILRDKCATCHLPGGAAPFAFNSYEKARSYSDMIHEVLITQRMPPWHADPAYGHFANDRALSDAQLQTLVGWVNAGAPRGEGEDPLLQVKEQPVAKWKLGEPDFVLGMSESFHLPAEGTLEYHVIKVPTNFTEDKWIRGIEVRPGNAKVLHHALFFIDYPENLKAREPHAGGGMGGYFAGYVPGAEPYFFPENTGKYMPAGCSIIFQLHYVTTGKPEEDLTQVGFHFCKTPPAERIETEAASDSMFTIPPRQRDVPATADDGFWMEAKLWGLSPHMHYRGKRFKYTAQYPDGSTEVLLSVPNFNFDWQTMYYFAEPKVMPRGTGLLCEGGFDNSVTNPANPNPDDTVRFGDQTHHEMFIGYYEYSAPVEAWERRLRQREKHMAQAKAEFDAANPGVSAGPPMTLQEIIGTTWKDDRYVFTFKENNEMVVNSIIKGKWKLENNRVIIDVVGEHFELDVIGHGLFFNGTYPIEQVK